MRRISHFIQRSMMGALSFLKESIFAEEYASRKGFLQERDPRLKTISLGLLLLSVLFTKNIIFLIGVYFFCLLLAYVSSLRLGFFLKRTWFFIPLFSLFIAIPAIFSVFSPGQPLVVFKFFGLNFSVTKEGLASSFVFIMRVLTSVSIGILLALTTRHYALLKVMSIFSVPRIFVMTLGMCYRYIYIFIEILQNTYIAIKSRVEYVTGVKKGQRVVAYSIASLWQRSYQMQNDVYQAMLSRGYDAEPKLLDEFCATFKDWIWLVAIAILFLLSLWKDYYLN